MSMLPYGIYSEHEELKLVGACGVIRTVLYSLHSCKFTLDMIQKWTFSFRVCLITGQIKMVIHKTLGLQNSQK